MVVFLKNYVKEDFMSKLRDFIIKKQEKLCMERAQLLIQTPTSKFTDVDKRIVLTAQNAYLKALDDVLDFIIENKIY